jgi:hypothetical protein
MPGDEVLFGPEPDPERTGIILDRLASELGHALRLGQGGAAELEEDARTFLSAIRDWLEGLPGDLDVMVSGVEGAPDAASLAAGLSDLAERLLDLAEQGLPADPQGE